MAHQIVNTTDYRDALAKLDQFITSRHVATVAINAGGTGYAVDDVLTVAGGTLVGGMAATIEVTSVAAGVIDGARLLSWGAYTVDPTTTANAVTGGTGSGATFDLTTAGPDWTQRIGNVSSSTTEVEVIAGVLGAGGTGYVVSDVVTLSSTVANSGEATFTITQVDGSGAVTGFEVTTGGNYTAAASGSFGTTGGTGTGFTLNPEFQPTRDEYWWEGTGTGGNAVYCGIRTGYVTVQDQRCWELAGGTGWNNGSDWESQPGISPGRNTFNDSGISNTNGACIHVGDFAMEMRVYANARRIIAVVNVAGNIQSLHLGLVDPYGTDSEFPYPCYVAGSSNTFVQAITTDSIAKRGPADPTYTNTVSTNDGPRFRDGAGVWQNVFNGGENNGSISSSGTGNYNVWPCSPMDFAGLLGEDSLASQISRTWTEVIPENRSSTPSVRFFPAPDPGGDIYFPIPCVIMSGGVAGQHRAVGEINGLYWVSAEEGLSSGDKITVGSRVFRVFQMGLNTQSFAHFAVEEA